MTDTSALIELYVSDVVKRLPRRQRDDVAVELRELLHEELAGRVDEAGSGPDEAMTYALLHGFGRPAEVAARYRPAPTVIDPADARWFVRASVIGVAVIWALGLAEAIRSTDHWLAAAQAFWLGAALPALVWPGFLVVCAALSVWVRRRWPATGKWTPGAADRDQINRVGYGAALAFFVVGTVVLVDPARLLDVMFGGRAAPAAYDAFVYDPAFLRLRGPLVLGTIVVNLALLAVLVVRGRWTPVTRQLELAMDIVMCAVFTWVLVAGPVFVATPTDQFFKATLVVMIVLVLADLALKFRRQRRRARRLTPVV